MHVKGYLNTYNKDECFGCEACVQVCSKNAIKMVEDCEGFRYPVVNDSICINCGLCNSVCPYENPPKKMQSSNYAFGGYIKDENIRFSSTSGGAFSAIVDAYCDENYAIFGAASDGLNIFHTYITNKKDIGIFRKSKYSQSKIGTSYKDVRTFLLSGKKVLFSGTPCQIAGLKKYLRNTNTTNLLTVEVVCEGIPSPLYIRKYEKSLEKKYGRKIESLDYRYTGKSCFNCGKWDFKAMKVNTKIGGGGKWDFQVMKTRLVDNKKEIIVDRWFNPFWSIWLQHLMSRPSCYECPFAKSERIADITLGDLWGVHLYCPELYGNNGGASVVFANSDRGKEILLKAQEKMYGHELEVNAALKYQGPMRKHIDSNPSRSDFIKDLQSDMRYEDINKKWAKKPTLKLLWQKYVWGNRQKIWLWNITNGKYKIK